MLPVQELREAFQQELGSSARDPDPQGQAELAANLETDCPSEEPSLDQQVQVVPDRPEQPAVKVQRHCRWKAVETDQQGR